MRNKSFDMQPFVVGTLFFYPLAFMWYFLQIPDQRHAWLPYMGLPLYIMTLLLITNGKGHAQKRRKRVILSTLVALGVFFLAIGIPIPQATAFCPSQWCSTLSLRPVIFWTGMYVSLALIIPFLGLRKASRTTMLTIFFLVCLGATMLALL